MSAIETTPEENMTLNKCPLTFTQSGDHFYVERQEDLEWVNNYEPKVDKLNKKPIEVKNGYRIRKSDGREFQVTTEKGKLSISEISFPASTHEETENGPYAYTINGVEVKVTEASDGKSKVSYKDKTIDYVYRKSDAIDITDDCSIHLTSAHDGPTRVILYKKMLTNLDQS